MVYFGWRRAHEDDAVRAIRAGLEFEDAVSRLKVASPIRAWVGTDTGVVVVGSHAGRIVIFACGIPLKDEGESLGAIGVSGGKPDRDHRVPQAGATAF
jgi:uncharacterized protein GlcG (DUF336 family)